MKTSIAFAALLFGALFSANVCSAQSHSTVEAETFSAQFTQLPGSTKVRVWVVKPAGKKLWVTVKDAANYDLCYLEMLSKETEHLFLVDMKEMPEGKYTFELESAQKAANGKRPVISKTVIKEKKALAQPIIGERFVFVN